MAGSSMQAANQHREAARSQITSGISGLAIGVVSGGLVAMATFGGDKAKKFAGFLSGGND